MKNRLETEGTTGVWDHCTTDREIDEYFGTDVLTAINQGLSMLENSDNNR